MAICYYFRFSILVFFYLQILVNGNEKCFIFQLLIDNEEQVLEQFPASNSHRVFIIRFSHFQGDR